jgi:hypothetical protein
MFVVLRNRPAGSRGEQSASTKSGHRFTSGRALNEKGRVFLREVISLRLKTLWRHVTGFDPAGCGILQQPIALGEWLRVCRFR